MRQQRLKINDGVVHSRKNPLDKMRQYDERNPSEARKVLVNPRHQPLFSIAWEMSVTRRPARDELAALEQRNTTNEPERE